MLDKSKTFTSFSTDDIDEAKEFYGEKLGLEIEMDMDGAVVFKTGGDTKFMVYEKDDHQAANYTVLNFEVEDIKEQVRKLNEEGIVMEQYEFMRTDELGIAPAGDVDSKMAWFVDPAGNIVGLIEN